MQNRKLKWVTLALVPAVLLASLSNLIANRASGRLDDATRLELSANKPGSSQSAAFSLARPTRQLLPVAMDRAEIISSLSKEAENRLLDDLQKQIGVYRPWPKN